MYKLASQLKLRFATTKGELTVEQLWDLPLSELDSLAVSLEDAYKASKGKSFLDKKSKKDKTIKLQFDLVLDILNTKVEEETNAKEAYAVKAHNEKIEGIIAKKQEEELENKSVEELQEMLKK